MQLKRPKSSATKKPSLAKTKTPKARATGLASPKTKKKPTLGAFDSVKVSETKPEDSEFSNGMVRNLAEAWGFGDMGELQVGSTQVSKGGYKEKGQALDRTVTGSDGRDSILGRSKNMDTNIDLKAGDDYLNFESNGRTKVDSGSGNDKVRVHQNWSEFGKADQHAHVKIDSGSGNDEVEFNSFHGGKAEIDMGSGDDKGKFHIGVGAFGRGDVSINGGDGHDSADITTDNLDAIKVMQGDKVLWGDDSNKRVIRVGEDVEQGSLRTHGSDEMAVTWGTKG